MVERGRCPDKQAPSHKKTSIEKKPHHEERLLKSIVLTFKRPFSPWAQGLSIPQCGRASFLQYSSLQQCR